MAGFYAARSGTIPPLPWTNFAPPLSPMSVIRARRLKRLLPDANVAGLAQSAGPIVPPISHRNLYNTIHLTRGIAGSPCLCAHATP